MVGSQSEAMLEIFVNEHDFFFFLFWSVNQAFEYHQIQNVLLSGLVQN